MAAKYNDEFHRKLRQRVAAHRKRKAAEIAARESAKRLAAGRLVTGRRAKFVLWERLDASGLPFEVELVAIGSEPSPDAVRSKWLPTCPLPRALAVKLRRQRLNQIYGVGL
jgi:hypothetical protein